MSADTKVLETLVLAEFATPDALVDATRQMREKGYEGMDTYSPYPLHGGSEALGLPPSRVPFIALCAGLTGTATAIAFMAYMNGFDYPLNVGGRPVFSLPSYVPITFELTVLLAAFGIFFGVLGLARLPQPYHPAYEHEAFRSATTHGYWLSVPKFATLQTEAIMDQLKALGATQVTVVTGEKE
jgi:multisubunit Na+/H+ antiporter MnhG subunit